MTPQQLNYFTGMQPGQQLTTSSVKDPDAMISAGKEYIDQTGLAVFSADYSVFTKLAPIPDDDLIHVFIS